MYLTWHGFSCIRLQTKDATTIIDPLPPTVGLSAPRLQADCFVFSSPSNPQLAKAEKTDAFTIATPGAYEVRGMTFRGIPHGNGDQSITLYTVAAEGMVLAHLGTLGGPIDGPHTEHLKDVDVLFIPVGGKPVLTAKQATEVVTTLEPRVVIPMYYHVPGLKVHLDGVELFLKELGVKNSPAQEKIRLSKKELPEGDMHVIVLKP